MQLARDLPSLGFLDVEQAPGEPMQTLSGAAQLGALLGLVEDATQGVRESRKVLFREEISRPAFQAANELGLVGMAGEKDERRGVLSLLVQGEGGQAVETGQAQIGQNDVVLAPVQRRFESGARLHAKDFHIPTGGEQRFPDEQGIVTDILQM
ncbi:MAG TPA: hypothetical protein VGD81_07705 [Opitutaceae bacterium]